MQRTGTEALASAREGSPTEAASSPKASSSETLHAAGNLAIERMASAEEPMPGYNATYAPIPGQAFVRGKHDATDIAPDDVQQGQIGDCWLMSAMIAVAAVNPEAIRRLIKDNGDGTYDVTLYFRSSVFSAKTPHVYRVDCQFPIEPGGGTKTSIDFPNIVEPIPKYAQTGDAGPKGPELWPMLLEKAFAMRLGKYTGNVTGLGASMPVRGLEALMPGTSATYLTLTSTQDVMLRQIVLALREHRPITASTGPTISPSARARAEELGLEKSAHAYAVIAADLERRTVSLRNPGGSDVAGLSIEDFNRFIVMYAIGPKA